MTRWIKFFQHILVISLGLIWLLGAALPVHAQNGFTLSVDPLISQVPVGTELVLELLIEEGVDLNAFDVTVRYNPDTLSLKDWDYGDYFTNLASMTVVTETNSIRVAATQVASEPVSGDGSLLSLTFTADAEGFSSIDIIQAEFADAEGNKVEPEVVNGQVTVTLEPTFTPTLTKTPTRTPTRTVTPLPTGTRTPSRTVTGIPTSTPAQTETAAVFNTQTPTSAFTETPSGLTGTALTRTPTGTDVAGTADGSLTPTITRSPWPVLAVTGTSTPLTSVTPSSDIDEPLPTPDQDQDSRNLLNGLLWGVLIAGVIVLLVLIVLIIRKKAQEEEDLLL